MKNLKLKTLILFLVSLILNIQDIVATNQPPAPKGGFDKSYVVGGAIDDYLPLLFLASLILGVWAINRYKNQETKNV